MNDKMLYLRLFGINSIHFIDIKLYRKQKGITLGQIQIFFRAVLCDTFEPSRAPTGKCTILQKVKLPSDMNLSKDKFESKLTKDRIEPTTSPGRATSY